MAMWSVGNQYFEIKPKCLTNLLPIKHMRVLTPIDWVIRQAFSCVLYIPWLIQCEVQAGIHLWCRRFWTLVSHKSVLSYWTGQWSLHSESHWQQWVPLRAPLLARGGEGRDYGKLLHVNEYVIMSCNMPCLLQGSGIRSRNNNNYHFWGKLPWLF